MKPLLSEPVVFFGSGPVAAAALRRLAAWAEIEAVITKPQPAHHRETFPVIAACADLGLSDKMLTVSTRAELSSLFLSQHLASRLGVVVDFGIIIAADVIDAFPLGIVNSHFSLLPRWRGADPITFSILAGDAETGVSLMLIVPELDAGPLLAQEPFALPADITTPVLTDRLIALSDSLLQRVLPAYAAGSVTPQPQPAGDVTFSRKLTRDDGLLDFTRPAAELERQIRAFTPWPRSRTVLAGHDAVITAAHVLPAAPSAEPDSDTAGNGESRQPGDLWLHEKQLGIRTGDGSILVIDQLVPAGKKPMSGSDFLLGYRVGHTTR